MSATLSSQAHFTKALLDQQAAVPPELVPAHRFSVYRNNVHTGLRKALAETYPVVKRLVGAKFFDALAEEFIARALPTSPVLTEYGEAFALLVDEFCASHAKVPYLADVARLEWAHQRAYHAAEAEAIDPQALTNIPQAEIAMTVFQLHPTLRLLKSPWPIHEIWNANRAHELVQPIALTRREQGLMLLRAQAQVNIHRLLPGGFEFVLALQHGETLGTACELARSAAVAFDLAGNLQAALEHGAICGYHSGTNPP